MKLSKYLRLAEDNRIIFYCPGCDNRHNVRVNADDGPSWFYNNNAEKPTFTPSVLTRWNKQLITDEEYFENMEDYLNGSKIIPYINMVCHLFITDGMIQYLDDCTHELKGKIIPMQEI